MPTPKRGEVWIVRFDPAVGAEIQKVRPAVVIGVDSVGRLPLKIVVPITDWKPVFANFAWFVNLPATPDNGLAKDSGADAFQVKSVSEDRFLASLGELTADQVDDIAAAVAACVGAHRREAVRWQRWDDHRDEFGADPTPQQWKALNIAYRRTS